MPFWQVEAEKLQSRFEIENGELTWKSSQSRFSSLIIGCEFRGCAIKGERIFDDVMGKMRDLMIAFLSGVVWRRRSRQRNCEAIYSRVDRVNSGGILCAIGCKATSGAVTTKSLRRRRTEGLSDKYSLHGIP